VLVCTLRILSLVGFLALVANGQIEWRNIKDFGAVPNDGLDDSEAIQAAFNSLHRERGGTVYCPTGVYDVFRPITVSTPAVRFLGDGGPAFNEGFDGLRGCGLVARSELMTLLKFDGGALVHQGPVIEYVNLREATENGHTATLLEIRHFNRWTVRNVSVGNANVGLRVNAGSADASWGYVSQFVCWEANTCIDQAVGEGGFLVLGGDFEALSTGIRIRGAQARIVGAKFDCTNGGVAIHSTGHGGTVTGSLFEQCGIGVKIQDDGAQSWSGEQHRVIGNHFRGWDGGLNKGVEIGPNCVSNQVIGNTYEAVSTPVDDRGASTKRYEEGVGANISLTCPPGQAIRSITVKEGIVTRAVCGGL
jgi:hypothetical protein